MNRRNFLAALGFTAAGGTTVIGTGAFTSVRAERQLDIRVAGDRSAFLALEPTAGPNGSYASTTGDDLLALDLSGTTAGGEGLGTDSVYRFDDVFRLSNQGTQPVYVWVTLSGRSGNLSLNGSDPDVYFYPNGDPTDRLRDGPDDVLYLGVGGSATVGVYVDTTGVAAGQTLELTATIHADAQAPTDGGGSGEVVGGGGGSIPGPTTGLVGYWPLDAVGNGRATDWVAGNDGTTNGGVSVATGRVGGAARFDGQDDYVRIPDAPTLDRTQALTLAAWVYAAGGQDDYARILSRERSGVGNRQYNLGFDSAGNDPRTVVDTTSQDGVTVSGSVPTAGMRDSWHHVALTFDAADAAQLYVDGTPVAETVVSAPLVSRDSPVAIGAPAHLPGKDHFAGRIDDVRIYDRALSSAEVGHLYRKTD
jgi:hypothetical protein